jgi:hypothetical protein
MVEMAAREPSHDPDSSGPGSPGVEPESQGPQFPDVVDAEVHARWPLGAAAQVLLLGHLREVLARRGPVAAGSDDVEHLHKLRVACRRLRSALHGTAELWPRKTSRAALRAIKDLAKACSRARDLDVEAEHLSALVPDAPHDEELALRWLWARARQARHHEQARVREAVRRFDEDGWPERLVTLFATSPVDLASWTPPAPKSKSKKPKRKPRVEQGPDDRGDDSQPTGKAKAARPAKRSGRATKSKRKASPATRPGADDATTRNNPRRKRTRADKARPSRNKVQEAGAEPSSQSKPLRPPRKRAQ